MREGSLPLFINRSRWRASERSPPATASSEGPEVPLTAGGFAAGESPRGSQSAGAKRRSTDEAGEA